MTWAADLIKQAEVEGGFYKGKPASPDSVKFETDFQGLKVKVDRPKGFIMFGTDHSGAKWRRTYKVDYGFIPKTLGGDSDGLDVFIGPSKKAANAFWVVQRKPDGSFDEYKIFLGFDNRDEAIACYRAHIPKKFFGRMMSMTVEMMKAMLGDEPQESVKPQNGAVKDTSLSTRVKKASWSGFLSEMLKQVGTAVLVLLLVFPSTARAQSVESIPPGPDKIQPLQLKEPAPYSGMLYDYDTALRWGNWLKQYQLRLKIDVEAEKKKCDVELAAGRKILALTEGAHKESERDLKARVLKLEQRNVELEKELRNPSWYNTRTFGVIVGVTGSALLFGLSVYALDRAR